MKLAPRAVGGFLGDPGTCRVVLLFGEDVGLIGERAAGLVRLIAGSLDDPFRISVLEPDQHDRLREEATAISMIGGRRVVRVRDVRDSKGFADQVSRLLKEGGDSFIVLEGPELPTKSKLRTLLEPHAQGAAIACYRMEPRELEDTVSRALGAHKIGVDSDAKTYLASHLGADTLLTRAELEKLALFVGDGGRADLHAAEECVGDGAAHSLDNINYGATSGDVAGAGRALTGIQGEGGSVIPVLRALLGHLQRLHLARLEVERGASPSQVVSGQRPPIFFKRAGAFEAAIRTWDAASLMRAMQMTFETENACKKTGAPDQALVSDLIQRIAMRGRALARAR